MQENVRFILFCGKRHKMRVRKRNIGMAVTHSCACYRRILRGMASFAELPPARRFVSLSPSSDKSNVAEFNHVDGALVGLNSREFCDEMKRTRTNALNVC